MYSVEAQYSPHTSSCTWFSKDISLLHKIFLNILTNSILYSVPSFDQKYFWKLLDFQNHFSKRSVLACCGRPDGRPALFQVRTVDRAVDRASDHLGVCMCARYPVDRTPCRSTELRPTESTLVSVLDGRQGGRPWAGNGHIFLKTGRPAGRPWANFQPKRLVF